MPRHSRSSRIGCPNCKAVINLRPKKEPVAVAAVPLPPKVSPSFASPATVAPSLAPATDAMSVPNHVLMRELARGGLGVVYLAHHVALNDLRAIERPLALDGLDRDVILARFRREVQAIGPLRSDRVVRVHVDTEDQAMSAWMAARSAFRASLNHF